VSCVHHRDLALVELDFYVCADVVVNLSRLGIVRGLIGTRLLACEQVDLPVSLYARWKTQCLTDRALFATDPTLLATRV